MLKEKNKKIVLIQPPVRDFYFTPTRSFPLGLCSIAAVLIKKGHSVSILDCVQGGSKSDEVTDDRDFDYLREYYVKNNISPFGLFKYYKHYGLSFSAIEKLIVEMKADVFGISSLFSAYADEALKVAKIIKNIYPNSYVVLGGYHAHEYSEYILNKNRSVDYIVLGEGEETFEELVSHLDCAEDVPGIAYRKEGKVVYSRTRPPQKDLSLFPVPDRSLLELSLYTIGSKRYSPIQTSRGCPRKCSFCSISHFIGNSMRLRDIQDVCNEIKYCFDELNIKIFDIEDDNFTCNMQHASSLLKTLIKCLEYRQIELTALNGFYYENLNEELIMLLHKVGMQRICLSLVTTSNITGDRIERNINFDKFEKIVKYSLQEGMRVLVSFILGIPGETKEEMLETLAYLAQFPVLTGPSIYYHVPGSKMFSVIEEKDSKIHEKYKFFRSTALFYEDENFNRCDIITVLRLTRIVNYIKASVDKNSIKGDFIAWLHQKRSDIIQERVRIKNDFIDSKGSLSLEDIGVLLLYKFFKEKRICSVKKISNKTKNTQYSFEEEVSSSNVITKFFDVFNGKSIAYGEGEVTIHTA